MKFSEFPYVRPDIEAVCNALEVLTKKFAQCDSAQSQIEVIKEYRDVLMGNQIDSFRSQCSL